VNEIIKYVYRQKMKEHCATKEGLSPEAFDTIDWDAIKDSTDSSPELFNLWMTKQISGFCPCGKNMKRWGFWEDSKNATAAQNHQKTRITSSTAHTRIEWRLGMKQLMASKPGW
jgi:hypothetical protein